MNDPGRIVIIGAGPAGLGAAHRLQELGHTDHVLLDGRAGPGGLASSVVDDHGFTWDIGGHVQFSHYAYYDDVLDSLGLEWLHHERESWVWIRNRFVPYPFQNNIHKLDEGDCERALRGLEDAAAHRASLPKPENFREWIVTMFGDGLADIFMKPYNFKVWGYPLEVLGTRWVGERVAVPDIDRIRTNIREQRDDVSWGPNARFRFPLTAGTGAIWQALAARLDARRFIYGDRVIRIDPVARTVTLASGRTLAYDTLINTMPLVELARIIDGFPDHGLRAAESLLSSSVHIFGIGLRHDRPASLEKKCWMYFPETNSPYYRVTMFSHYSPRNVPEGGGYWSLMAEVSETAMKRVDVATIFDDVVHALREDRLIGNGSEIVSRWYHREQYGYPTPSTNRDAALEVVQPLLETSRIFSRGRFGAWKYEVSNQDHSFMQGVELVDALTGGGDEPTLTRPDYANSGVFLRKHVQE
jgi:protoporphyrinogen oxidase